MSLLHNKSHWEWVGEADRKKKNALNNHKIAK